MKSLQRLVLLLITISGCHGDLTQDFIGDWILTEGILKTDCPGSTNTAVHEFGDMIFSIDTTDDNNLRLTLFVQSKGLRKGLCDLSATVSSETTAELNARACMISGSQYNVIEGSLLISDSHSMLLNLHAEVPSPGGACHQTSTSTLRRM